MASPAVCVSPLSPCLLTSCHPSRPSHSRSVKASSPFMNRSLSRGRGHICGGDDLQDERREKLRRGRRGRCWHAESIWDLSFGGFSQFSGSRFSRVSDSLRSVSWISFGFELLVVALETVMDILLFNDFFFLDQMINLKDLDSVTKIYMNRNTHTASNMMIRTEKQILRAEPVFMFWCRYRYIDNSTKTQRFFAAIPQMWLTNTTTRNDGSIFSFQ